ncbi:MAG: hypothetical protein GF329_22335 [Candidatus Lokiarchaeota archaeon]|nr:hypothetical protein [Candidatus Lokiarchaeota archaeon]
MITSGAICQYDISIVATMMLGWTIILLWADRDPLERRDIIIITFIPIIGLQITEILGFVFSFSNLVGVIFSTISSILLSILFIYSYLNSRKNSNKGDMN